MLDVGDLLQSLTRIPAIPGHEEPVARHLETLWRSLGAETRLDRLGNCLGLLPGRGPEPRPRVLAAAHMDQIGLMITAIEPGGFLRFTGAGGWDRRILQAQQVMVHGRQPVPGVIASRPPHLTPAAERSKVPPIDQLYIDTGLSEAEVTAQVPVGAMVTVDYEFLRLANERYASPAMDDRACLAVLTLALEELAGMERQADFIAAGTKQEESGFFLGASTAAWGVAPTVAIAVDVTFGTHPGSSEDSFPLDEGPTVLVGANAHPQVSKLMREICKETGIPYQVEVIFGNSGTDAWAMQVAAGGCASGLISVPIRYMHTPVETIAGADVRSAARLLARFVSRVDAAFVEALTWE